MRFRFIFIIIAVLFSPYAMAQDDIRDKFKIENSQVVWYEVFETSLQKDEIMSRLRSSGKAIDFTETENAATCRLVPHKADYKGAGFDRMSVALYVVNYTLEAYAQIQFKPGRYRVKVSNITFTDTKRNIEGIEPYALTWTRDGFKSIFYDINAASVLDFDFHQIFSIPDTNTDEEDW